MNDTIRAQWCSKDEGLRKMWRKSGLLKRDFVRAHRYHIDVVILNATNEREAAQRLAFPKLVSPHSK